MFHILIGRVQPLLDANFPSAANLHPVIIFASSCFYARLFRCSLSLDAMPMRNCVFPRCLIITQMNLSQMLSQQRQNLRPCFYDWLLLCEITCKTVSTVNGYRSVLYCITLSYCGCWCDLIVVFLLCRFYSSFSLQRFVLELCYSCSLRQMLWWYIKCSDKEPCFLLCSSTGGTTRLLIHDTWSELR